MDGRESIQSILVLRKVTRAIAEEARSRVLEYLTTLGPLIRPETVFAEHIQGARRESTHKPNQALKELQTLYEDLAPARPLNLRRALTPPFDLAGMHLEITPVEYMHAAQSGAGSRQILVRRPLTWTLTYAGFEPPRFRELLDMKLRRSEEEIQRFIVSYLLLDVVTKHQSGVVGILETLHFPITRTTLAEFGELPVVRISLDVATERPPDGLIIESAELTGMDAFEEVVRLEDISRLGSPFKDRLLEIVRQHAPALAPS
jgi:hypothetical protein